MTFPMAHFGSADNETKDWRQIDLGDDNDEELPKTPQDVIEMLGFDPSEIENK